MSESEPGKVKCPKCDQDVDVVDGEYARHYIIANVVCTMSRREIREEIYDNHS